MNQEQEKRSKIGTHQLKMVHADSLSINFLQDYVSVPDQLVIAEQEYISLRWEHSALM